MRWSFACAVAAELYAQYPEQVSGWVKGIVPVHWWPHIVSGAFLMGALWRILRFEKLNQPK
jgi:hypothetical protein